mgnify:CR=1 FL=1
MSRLKLALLGCGDVAHRDYLPEFHRLAAGAELVAVCSRTPARVAQAARRSPWKVRVAHGVLGALVGRNRAGARDALGRGWPQ